MLTPFRYRNYRVFWIGLLGSVTGHQIQNFSNLWFTYDLTGSPFYLGLVGATLATSTIVFSMFGGVLADRVDRRRLLLFTQSSLGIIMFVLATLILFKMATIWHLLAIAFFSGSVQAFDRPARESLIPHLIEDRKDLLNATALSSTIWQISRIGGPALAGIIISITGAAVAFYIASFLYISLIAAVIQVRMPAHIKSAAESNMWKSFVEGLAYLLKNPVCSAIIGMTFVNSIFGLSYLFLMPVFTRDILKVGPEGYGFVMTAIGIGGLLGTFTSAALGRTSKKYIPLIAGSLVSGMFIIVFAHSKMYPLSLAMAAMAAMATNVYMTIGQTVLLMLVPDNLRGRAMSTYGLVWSLIPLGSLQSGAIATYLGAPIAVTIGASVLLAFSLFILAFAPGLRKLRI